MEQIFLNIPLNIKEDEDFLMNLSLALQKKEMRTFYYLNTYSFYLFHHNPEFKKAFLKADYIFADGYGIVCGVEKLLSQKISKIGITYMFLKSLGNYLSDKNHSVYFLGASADVLNDAVANIKKRHINLEISGYHHGYFDKEKESQRIIDGINSVKPDVLLVGMGMPLSEIWIEKYKSKIEAKCIISVGGFFDILAGKTKLPPEWFYNSGFEWTYRLLQEPGRLWKRYLKAHSYYLAKLFQEILKKKMKAINK